MSLNVHAADWSLALNQAGQTLSEPVSLAAERMVAAFMADAKVLTCGNGVSATSAQHFAAILASGLQKERMGLPAWSLTANSALLTAIGNNYDFAQIFSRQIKAAGKHGDILAVFSTSGQSINVLEAVASAHERDMRVIAFTGEDGGQLGDMLREDDVLLKAPASSSLLAQALHIFLIQAICEEIDQILFSDADWED